jgi:hypothetical protein
MRLAIISTVALLSLQGCAPGTLTLDEGARHSQPSTAIIVEDDSGTEDTDAGEDDTAATSGDDTDAEDTAAQGDDTGSEDTAEEVPVSTLDVRWNGNAVTVTVTNDDPYGLYLIGTTRRAPDALTLGGSGVRESTEITFQVDPDCDGHDCTAYTADQVAGFLYISNVGFESLPLDADGNLVRCVTWGAGAAWFADMRDTYWDDLTCVDISALTGDGESYWEGPSLR